jgi:hypothetical protein
MAISIEDNTIYGVGSDPEAITAWEVWFLVPMKGLVADREEAVKACKENDFNPDDVLIPVSVAIGERGGYEPVLK